MFADRQWLLFLPQLPAGSSSGRVGVWRRMRAAGAIGLQNGVWVLPQSPAHERLVHDELAEVERLGGSGITLVVTASSVDLTPRFCAERDLEYAEICERCQGFLDEQDLQKLMGWSSKVHARDFFGASGGATADAALVACREALQTFTRAVYDHEGLDEDF